MSRGFIEPVLMKYLYRKATANNTPLAATFELLPLCNMDCRMCYVRLTKEEVKKRGSIKSVQEWLDFAGVLRDRGVLFLLLTGGEPFLYEGFKELYIGLIKMGFVININSNGTLIGDEEIELLKKYPPMKINITLYGGSRETYKNLCGYEAGFDKAIYAIKKLKEADINVKIHSSITPYNIADVDDIIRISEELKCALQATTYMFPPTRRDEELVGINHNRFSAEDAGKFAVEIERKQFSEEVYRYRLENLLNDVRIDEDGDDNKIDYGQQLLCKAGRSAFWVTWDGRMTPCGMMDFPVEYPFEEGFDASWKSLVEKVQAITLSSECATCSSRKTCMTCAAMAVTEMGDFSKTPRYICDMNRVIVEESRRIYDEIVSVEEAMKDV